MPLLFILLAVVAVVVLYLWSTYNSFAVLRTRIRASIQEIGNQLKRQTELVPNLQSSAKGYLDHEKEIFEKLTQARKMVLDAVQSGVPQEMVDAGNQLMKALAPIRVVLESNPQLQAKDVVVKLMDELRDTSDKVMYSRRTLIDLSADYNIKLATVPSGWVGKIFGFQPEKGLKTPESGEHIEVSQADTKTPQVKL